MTNPPAFNEPGTPNDDPFSSGGKWLRSSGSSKARETRTVINDLYSTFPDRHGMLLSRLRLDDENEIFQAFDELYVHHLLSRSSEVRYEEDDESPDFRLYRSSSYIAGIEVMSLFTKENLQSEGARNDVLTQEINRRVRPTLWHLSYEVRRWSKPPRPKHLAKWLSETIESIGEPRPGLPTTTYPRATYRTDEVELRFTFFPRSRTEPPKPSERTVVATPWIGGFIQPDRRIRDRLSKKVGKKYNHRNQPFAVAMSIRDPFCDVEDIVNTLYGYDAASLAGGKSNSPQSIENVSGIFGASPAHPEGRVRRLSSVFVLTPGWTPLSREAPRIIRLDNPWAQHTFPADVLVPDLHLTTRKEGTGTLLEWVHSLGE